MKQTLKDRCNRLAAALSEALDQKEALQAAIDKQQAEIDNLVAWITGDRDALACLQSIYNSTTASEANRAKAAAAAIGFERSKPAAGLVVMDFRERVRAARLWADAQLLKQAPKTIEHIPESDLPESA